jgi:aspartate dehydrogenase
MSEIWNERNYVKKIVLIGFGAIARIMRQKLAEHDPAGKVSIAGVLVREPRVAETSDALGPDIPVVTTIAALLDFAPDIVVECAGQGAIIEYGETVLAAGYDLMIISTGALADDGLRQKLVKTAERSNGHLVLPAGAIAGIDGLNALRIGGLTSVRYTSTKPPGAWVGTPAEDQYDLPTITERTVLYTGPANEAARLYPKNANLAATVALAGLGMERTEIQLVADPGVAPHNVGRIDAVGEFGTLAVESRGLPAPDNPKTSASTALSLAHAVLKDTSRIVI